jgi:chromate reductase, NAD(P)H dehydrogenase (quinone)
MKDQYVIISGTNREGSNSLKVAIQYQQLLREEGIDSSVVSLEDLELAKRNPAFVALETSILIPARKIIFISPEYNGSIPGVLKSMFDISEYKKVWWGKKALLVGVSTGRSGNVRGMEHLTSILNYLKVVVHPNKLPISSVDRLLNPQGIMGDVQTVDAMRTQLEEFIAF